MIVTMRHVRAAGMCSEGAREFCKRYEINWLDFLKNGIEAERLRHIDNALLQQVLKVAENGR